jgi:hypothetical protein
MMAPMPLVEPWAYAPNYLQMEPTPRLGQGRALVLNATELKLVGAPYENPLQELVCKRNALYGSLNLLERIPKIRGNESLYLRSEDETYGQLNLPQLPGPLADFLGLSHITSPGKPFEWRYRPSRMPWATMGQKAEFRDHAQTLAAISRADFDPSQKVILPLEAREAVSTTHVPSSRVLRADHSLSRWRLEVDTLTTTMLVLAQSWYHPWQAFVDGRATKIWKANGAYQALQIPAGHHQVELRYEDRRFFLGAILALAELAFLIAVQVRIHGRS